MYDKLPSDRQHVEVRLGNREWQPATYVDGEFVDAYGMPLDRRKISNWRDPNRLMPNLPTVPERASKHLN